MTLPLPAACTHELRPGTKVCLHCRRAQREATATRHRAILVKTGLIAAAIGASVFAGVSGLDAWKNRSGAGLASLMATPASLEAAPVPHVSAAPATPNGAVDSATPSPSVAAPTVGESTAPSGALVGPAQSVSGPALTPPAPDSPAPLVTTASASAPPTAVLPMRPVIVEGRTDLQNGIYALRTGDTVTVHFDTPEARTRRAEKFEQIVRATLPEVHGRGADSLLATIAAGNLVGDADLAGEQPPRAIRIRGRDGQSFSIWPQTRPGRDGPLVVAYRISPAP